MRQRAWRLPAGATAPYLVRDRRTGASLVVEARNSTEAKRLARSAGLAATAGGCERCGAPSF